MSKSSVLLLIISMFHAQMAFSQLFDGHSLSKTNLNDLVSRVQPGSLVLLGESHAVGSHRDQHVEVLQALRAKGLKVSVGLEFVNYTDQALVNQYRNGELVEADFLTAVKWSSGFSFDFYRPQLNFPQLDLGEQSLGLNLPRTITSKISRGGLISLLPEDLALMPPNFELGRDSYKQRFMDAAGSHCKSPDNCFTAQCAWDDTMAWQSVEFLTKHPDQVLVVVVGEFHVQFGGGIKHRVLQRLPGVNVVTLSQIWAEEMSDEDVAEEMQPSLVEGPRADFIWVSKP